jgi:hypothetical protein
VRIAGGNFDAGNLATARKIDFARSKRWNAHSRRYVYRERIFALERIYMADAQTGVGRNL